MGQKMSCCAAEPQNVHGGPSDRNIKRSKTVKQQGRPVDRNQSMNLDMSRMSLESTMAYPSNGKNNLASALRISEQGSEVFGDTGGRASLTPSAAKDLEDHEKRMKKIAEEEIQKEIQKQREQDKANELKRKKEEDRLREEMIEKELEQQKLENERKEKEKKKNEKEEKRKQEAELEKERELAILAAEKLGREQEDEQRLKYELEQSEKLIKEQKEEKLRKEQEAERLRKEQEDERLRLEQELAEKLRAEEEAQKIRKQKEADRIKEAQRLKEQQEAELIRVALEAERIREEQEALRLRKEQEAERLRQAKEEEKLRVKMEIELAERLRKEQEAERIRKEEEAERLRKEKEAAEEKLRYEKEEAERKAEIERQAEIARKEEIERQRKIEERKKLLKQAQNYEETILSEIGDLKRKVEMQYNSKDSLVEKIQSLIEIASYTPMTYNGQEVDGKPSMKVLEDNKSELDEQVQKALNHFKGLFEEEQEEIRRIKKEKKLKQKLEIKVQEFEAASLNALAEMKEKAKNYASIEEPKKALKKLQDKNWELPKITIEDLCEGIILDGRELDPKISQLQQQLVLFVDTETQKLREKIQQIEAQEELNMQHQAFDQFIVSHIEKVNLWEANLGEKLQIKETNFKVKTLEQIPELKVIKYEGQIPAKNNQLETLNKKIKILNENLLTELENARFQQKEEDYLLSLHKKLDQFEAERIKELEKLEKKFSKILQADNLYTQLKNIEEQKWDLGKVSIEEVLGGTTLDDREVDQNIVEKQQALLAMVQARRSELKSQIADREAREAYQSHLKSQAARIEVFASGFANAKAAAQTKDKKEKLEALTKPGLTFEDYTGSKLDGDAELMQQKTRIEELNKEFADLQAEVVKAFLGELNVVKAAAELLKMQKLAFRQHLDEQKKKIKEQQDLVARLGMSGDLPDRKAKLSELVEKPFQLAEFEGPIHENEQMLKNLSKEVAAINERTKKLLQDTLVLIEKKEKERQVVLQRQIKLYKDHLDGQKRRMNLSLPSFEEAKVEEDPKKKLALLQKCKPVVFADFKGVMPEGDAELREQEQQIAGFNKEFPTVLSQMTKVVEEIEARERKEELLARQRNAYKMHMYSQETMLQAVESKVETIRQIEDLKDRVSQLEKLQKVGSGFETYRGAMPDGSAEHDEMKDRALALDKFIANMLKEGRDTIKAREDEIKRNAKLERERKEQERRERDAFSAHLTLQSQRIQLFEEKLGALPQVEGTELKIAQLQAMGELVFEDYAEVIHDQKEDLTAQQTKVQNLNEKAKELLKELEAKKAQEEADEAKSLAEEEALRLKEEKKRKLKEKLEALKKQEEEEKQKQEEERKRLEAEEEKKKNQHKQNEAFAGLIDNGSIGSFEGDKLEKGGRMATGRSGFPEAMGVLDADDALVNGTFAGRLSGDNNLKRKSNNRITLRSGIGGEDVVSRKSNNRITLRQGLGQEEDEDILPRKTKNRIISRRAEVDEDEEDDFRLKNKLTQRRPAEQEDDAKNYRATLRQEMFGSMADDGEDDEEEQVDQRQTMGRKKVTMENREATNYRNTLRDELFASLDIHGKEEDEEEEKNNYRNTLKNDLFASQYQDGKQSDGSGSDKYISPLLKNPMLQKARQNSLLKENRKSLLADQLGSIVKEVEDERNSARNSGTLTAMQFAVSEMVQVIKAEFEDGVEDTMEFVTAKDNEKAKKMLMRNREEILKELWGKNDPFKEKRLYKATEKTQSDKLLELFTLKHEVVVPIKYLAGKSYLFGTRKISAQVVNGTLMVRVGGGFLQIEEFVNRHQEKEIDKLKTLMAQEFKQIDEIVKNLLNAYKRGKFNVKG